MADLFALPKQPVDCEAISTDNDRNNPIHSSVYVVGSNVDGDLINSNELRELSCINQHNAFITQINCADKYSIYSNDDDGCVNKNYWAIGDNKYGSCCVPKNTKYAKGHRIDYFDKHNIHIRKLCVDVVGSSTFWITHDGIAFGNGYNYKGQLGIHDYTNKYEPVLIKVNSINKEIIDIHSAFNHSIALCAEGNRFVLKTIIEKWLNNTCMDTQIPDDVLHIMIAFYCSQTLQVYITESRSVLQHNNHTADRWRVIDVLMHKEIVSIKTGYKHTLFLESDGTLWDLYEPQPLDFGGIKIKIKQIACGFCHNLAIDFDLKVYAWGKGNEGQLGNATRWAYDTSGILIDYFATYSIREIACGFYHSYCMTTNGEHYLFGSNSYNECVTFNKRYYVTTPFCINVNVLSRVCNAKTIWSVALGNRNTQLTLY